MNHFQKTRLGMLYGATQILSKSSGSGASNPPPIRGTSGVDFLFGSNDADVFDANTGGNDHIFGHGGNDTYRLGNNTDHDTVYETSPDDDGDKVVVDSNVNKNNVRMKKVGHDLFIEILDDDGEFVDSLKISSHYSGSSSQHVGIERVEFSGDFSWGDTEFADPDLIRGFSDGGVLIGRAGSVADKFDTVAGNHTLKGGLGDDIYRLGKGTGHDVIHESTSDSGDTIEIRGVDKEKVRLSRNGDNGHPEFGSLLVEILGKNGEVTDSLKVIDQFKIKGGENTGIEKLRFSNGEVWNKAKIREEARIRHGGWLFGSYDEQLPDTFDSASGNDILWGGSGSDIYWLGRDTGHDWIIDAVVGRGPLLVNVPDSGGDADEIRIKKGITAAKEQIRLNRNGRDMYVEVLNGEGAVVASMRAEFQYDYGKRTMEKVVFDEDGTIWGRTEFDDAEVRGRVGVTTALGSTGADVFDTNVGGDENLWGYGGDDTYILRSGTGKDTINETSSDAGDVIKLGEGITRNQVRIHRNGSDFRIQLLKNGNVTDSLRVVNQDRSDTHGIEKVVFWDNTILWKDSDLKAAIKRDAATGSNVVSGTAATDFFDANKGGNQILSGGNGNDIYRLGYDTDTDTVRESSSDSADEVWIKDDVAPWLVRLNRFDNHLHVELMNHAGAVTDKLIIENQYSSNTHGIEKIVMLSNGVEWGSAEISEAARKGGAGVDDISGTSGVDYFDGNRGGNDILKGKGGNDVYWLGYSTHKDTIYESSSDSGDEIRIASGVKKHNVHMRKEGNNLIVELRGDDGNYSHSLKVLNQYSSGANSGVEKIVFSDNTEWTLAKVARRDNIGTDATDFFNVHTGGDVTLRGGLGNDIYWLGKGTGTDTIEESSSDSADEVWIRSGVARETFALNRSGNDLHIELIVGDTVTDKLIVKGQYSSNTHGIEKVVFSNGREWGQPDLTWARIRGTSVAQGGNDERLRGRSNAVDIFDANRGGNDILEGNTGDDTYWLGYDTDHDKIEESSSDWGDAIRIKSGVNKRNVRMAREGNHLVVKILDGSGNANDSLKVLNQYSGTVRDGVEKLFFADGTEWLLMDWVAKLDPTIKRDATLDADSLSGTAGTDFFDANKGGNDVLSGGRGDDVYWLGLDTGADTVNESSYDYADEVWIKERIEDDNVRLRREGDDLFVEVRDGANGGFDNSLKFTNQYRSHGDGIERVVFADGQVWGKAEFDAAKTQAQIDEAAGPAGAGGAGMLSMAGAASANAQLSSFSFGSFVEEMAAFHSDDFSASSTSTAQSDENLADLSTAAA